MSFLEPLMLGLLAAAALPIVVHLYNRKRAVRRSFPALEFLLQSKKKLARRLKIRQLLLLAMRVGFFILLPLAIAKPYILSDEGISADEKLPSAVVYVLDDSYSMALQDGGASLYSKAQTRLLEHLDELRPWDRTALVFASTPDAPEIAEFVDDRSLVERRVQEHTLASTRVDLRRALESARDLIMTSELPVRRVVLFTDRGAGSWPEVLGENILGGVAHLELLDLGDSPSTNLALVDAGYGSDPTGLQDSYELWARVRGFGLEGSTEATVHLEIDGEVVASTVVTVEGEEAKSAVFTHALTGEQAWHRVTMRLESDADRLDTDNDFHFPLRRNTRIRALLVNGDPRTIRYQDELFYLERALLPAQDSTSPITTTLTTPESLNADTLDAYDVVVLANVAGLSGPKLQKLETFVDGGGGLLIAVGDKVEPPYYNQSFTNLLPRKLRDRKRLSELDDPDAVIKVTRFDKVDYTHAALDLFSLPGGEGLQQIQVYSYMLVEPGSDASGRILASYSDGAPALIERKVGAGRVMLLTTTLDRDWSDLCIRKSYLPLSRELVRFLARRSLGEQNELATVGEAHAFNLSGQIPDRVIIHGPDERLVLSRSELEAFEGNPAITPSGVGHYTIEVVENDVGVEVPDLTFAVNLDTSESDTARLDEDTLGTLWSGEPPPIIAGDGAALDPSRRLELWPVLLLIGLLLLYFETLIGLRRSFWLRIMRRTP